MFFVFLFFQSQSTEREEEREVEKDSVGILGRSGLETDTNDTLLSLYQ